MLYRNGCKHLHCFCNTSFIFTYFSCPRFTFREQQRCCLSRSNTLASWRTMCAHQGAPPSTPYTFWRVVASAASLSMQWRLLASGHGEKIRKSLKKIFLNCNCIFLNWPVFPFTPLFVLTQFCDILNCVSLSFSCSYHGTHRQPFIFTVLLTLVLLLSSQGAAVPGRPGAHLSSSH